MSNGNKIVMNDIYLEMADYIDSRLYINNVWTRPDNLQTVVSMEDIIKSFSGCGYSVDDIKYCYEVIENNIMGR